MLTHHRSVSLSFISTDLPIVNNIETIATLYQRENQKFHLVFNQVELFESTSEDQILANEEQNINKEQNLLWLEMSPYRIILTKQSKQGLNYRYFWEQGIYGMNRYWLNDLSAKDHNNFRLKNFTRRLTLKGNPLPETLRIDYELWSDRLNLGHYVLHLEMN